MALAHVFLHFRKHFSFEFSIIHIHHGPTSHEQQMAFRNQTLEFVQKFCLLHDIPFFTNDAWRDIEEMESEDQFRQYRYKYLHKIKNEQGMKWIVLAHHSEDLLETRMMRLIRGVGLEGLPAMKFIDNSHMRPLLEVSRKDLKTYLQKCPPEPSHLLEQAGLPEQGSPELKLKWIEDPSNSESDRFRNWLRNDWLLSLENKRAGSLKSLARSLENILDQSPDNSVPLTCIHGGELLLSEWLPLEVTEKKRALAQFMRDQGFKNYGLSHINEVLKRLDTEKKNLTFRLLQHEWVVDAGRLRVQGLG